jgi:peptidoglycan/xylan/chitin deacetylase (PgdA/CDA1 family)
MQIAIRSRYVRWRRARYAEIWPIDPMAAIPLDSFPGWPDGKQFAFVLTHDVESQKGLGRCTHLMDMEKRLGFRSAFNFVVEDYQVNPQLIQQLTVEGFEVGIHGLQHDVNMFKTEKLFREHAKRINNYLKSWPAVGFRTPCMYHNLGWIKDLDIEYDASTFDTDPFEPQPDGTGTIFPFMVGSNSHERSYVELPYTLPQDFTLFALLKEKDINIWTRKLDWIAEHNGMALVIVHPDYMNVNDDKPRYDEFPASFYEQFLEYIEYKYCGLYWHALPREVARFWRSIQ